MPGNINRELVRTMGILAEAVSRGLRDLGGEMEINMTTAAILTRRMSLPKKEEQK